MVIWTPRPGATSENNHFVDVGFNETANGGLGNAILTGGVGDDVLTGGDGTFVPGGLSDCAV